MSPVLSSAMTLAAWFAASSLAQAVAATPGPITQTRPEARAVAMQTLPASDIERRVVDTLQSRLRESGSTARIDRVTGLRDLYFPPGSIPSETVSVTALSIEAGTIDGRWPRKIASVPVFVRSEGRTVRRLEARVEASDPKPVLIYAESAAGKRPAVELALTNATVDLIGCEETPLAAAAVLTGLRTRRAVRAGRPVMLSDFESEPDVARREQVEIEVRRGAVRIATTGIALADARLGESVAVVPAHARAAVIARVYAKQKVEIDAASQ